MEISDIMLEKIALALNNQTEELIKIAERMKLLNDSLNRIQETLK